MAADMLDEAAMTSSPSQVLLLALVATLVGCGSRDGHAVPPWQPYNLVVSNYDSGHDVDVVVSDESIGKVQPGGLRYYWVKPGRRRLRIESDEGRTLNLATVSFMRDRAVNVRYFEGYGTLP